MIVSGGQLFGPAFVKHRFFTIPGTGVPVVDTAACGLKLAETLVTLRRTMGLATSQYATAPFRTPPRDVVDRVRREFLNA